jgi:membrane protein YqaA with SNARE-associated domain
MNAVVCAGVNGIAQIWWAALVYNQGNVIGFVTDWVLGPYTAEK